MIPIQVVPQSGARRSGEPPQREVAARLPDLGRFAVKVLITIDGQPWSGTKIIEAGVLHRVHAALTVPDWPLGANSLRISYVTTMPRGSFDMNELVVSREPGASKKYEVGIGARFTDPHMSGSDPSKLRLRAEFEIPDGDAVAAPVVGSYELDLIVSNPRQTPALGRRSVIDERVAAFEERFQQRIPVVQEEHRRDFDAALNALLAFQDLLYRSGLYKGRDDVPEKELQEKAYEYLHARLDPDDLRQKGKRAGGEFDIEYRTVTIELKVERGEYATEKLFEKYTRQPTQYSAADGQQLGIVFVLDVTKQSRPPGDLRNYVGFDIAPIHGFVEGAEAYSVGMAVIVSPANLRSPSDYS